MDGDEATVGTAPRNDDGRPAPVKELRDSLFLLGFVVSSLGAYVGLGMVAVRLLGR